MKSRIKMHQQILSNVTHYQPKLDHSMEKPQMVVVSMVRALKSAPCLVWISIYYCQLHAMRCERLVQRALPNLGNHGRHRRTSSCLNSSCDVNELPRGFHPRLSSSSLIEPISVSSALVGLGSSWFHTGPIVKIAQN